MIHIKENEEFCIAGRVFTYSINNAGNPDMKFIRVLSDKDKKKKSKSEFTPPTLQEVIDYFKLKGYSKESATKFYEYYDSADWKDGNGKQVKNWKQKAVGVWFRDENKIKAATKDETKVGFFKFDGRA